MTRTPPAPAAVVAAEYLVLPNRPRDIWYGYVDKPGALELVAFVSQRHPHISQSFDAQYLADALNEKAASSSLHADNAALRARLAAVEERERDLREAAEQVLDQWPHYPRRPLMFPAMESAMKNLAALQLKHATPPAVPATE